MPPHDSKTFLIAVCVQETIRPSFEEISVWWGACLWRYERALQDDKCDRIRMPR